MSKEVLGRGYYTQLSLSMVTDIVFHAGRPRKEPIDSPDMMTIAAPQFLELGNLSPKPPTIPRRVRPPALANESKARKMRRHDKRYDGRYWHWLALLRPS